VKIYITQSVLYIYYLNYNVLHASVLYSLLCAMHDSNMWSRCMCLYWLLIIVLITTQAVSRWDGWSRVQPHWSCRPACPRFW